MEMRKVISLLLAAVLFFAVLPVGAMAATEELTVGRTDVTSGGYFLNNGSGGLKTEGATASNYNVHYDKDIKTLTLNGYDGEEIRSKNIAELKIILAPGSTNKIDFSGIGLRVLSGSLTISGSGTLDLCPQDISQFSIIGINVYGNVTVKSGTVNIAIAERSYGFNNINIESQGVICDDFSMLGGTLTIDCGDINYTGNVENAIVHAYGIYCLKNFSMSGGVLSVHTGSCTSTREDSDLTSQAIYCEIATITGGKLTAASEGKNGVLDVNPQLILGGSPAVELKASTVASGTDLAAFDNAKSDTYRYVKTKDEETEITTSASTDISLKIPFAKKTVPFSLTKSGSPAAAVTLSTEPSTDKITLEGNSLVIDPKAPAGTYTVTVKAQNRVSSSKLTFNIEVSPAEELEVGMTDITTGGYYLNDPDGDGVISSGATAENYNVHYDEINKTLTLNGYDGKEIDSDNIADLKVILAPGSTNKISEYLGTGIDVNYGNLTISGSGTLDIHYIYFFYDDSVQGINVGGNITVEGGTVNIVIDDRTTGDSYEFIQNHGIVCRNFSMLGGTVTVDCGDINYLGNPNKEMQIENEGMYCYDKLLMSGGTLDVRAGSCTARATDYVSSSGIKCESFETTGGKLIAVSEGNGKALGVSFAPVLGGDPKVALKASTSASGTNPVDFNYDGIRGYRYVKTTDEETEITTTASTNISLKAPFAKKTVPFALTGSPAATVTLAVSPTTDKITLEGNSVVIDPKAPAGTYTVTVKAENRVNTSVLTFNIEVLPEDEKPPVTANNSPVKTVVPAEGEINPNTGFEFPVWLLWLF